MPKLYQLKRPDLAAAIARELRPCRDTRSQTRLLAARMAGSGEFTSTQIAEQLGISRRRFFDWMNIPKARRVEELVERRHGGGAPPRVRGQALTELQAGLQAGRWKRARDIQQWLSQQHGVKLKAKGVYYWLGILGGVLKVPRRTHTHKDAAAAVAFQQTLCQRLRNLNTGGGKPVRVWVANEHRYGLILVVRRCWTLKGQRPTAPYQTKYQWGYLTQPWRWMVPTRRRSCVCPK